MESYKPGLDKVLDAKVTLFLADYLVMEEKIDQLKKQITEFTEILPKELQKKLENLDEIFESIPTFIGSRLDEHTSNLTEISEQLTEKLENLTEIGLEEFLTDIENAKIKVLVEIASNTKIELKSLVDEFNTSIKEARKHDKKPGKGLFIAVTVAFFATALNVIPMLYNFNVFSSGDERNIKAMIFAKNYVLEKSSEKDKKEIERLFNEGGDIFLKSTDK